MEPTDRRGRIAEVYLLAAKILPSAATNLGALACIDSLCLMFGTLRT
jgi:hypothetical protein